MTAASTDAPVTDEQVPLAWVVSDALAVAQRNLLALYRIPTTLVFSTVQPVIFVLMFRYVFGGAIHIPGVRYVDFLMAGIFVQTVTFGSMNTGVGLAEDLHTGLIERFRSGPERPSGHRARDGAALDPAGRRPGRQRPGDGHGRGHVAPAGRHPPQRAPVPPARAALVRLHRRRRPRRRHQPPR